MSASKTELKGGIKTRQDRTLKSPVVPEVLSIELPNGKASARTDSLEDIAEDAELASLSQSITVRKSEYGENRSKAPGNARDDSKQPSTSAPATIVALPPAKKLENAVKPQSGTKDPADCLGVPPSAFHESTAVDGSDGREDHISDVAKQFLRQIPDLSFMLESTFCPPQHGKDTKPLPPLKPSDSAGSNGQKGKTNGHSRPVYEV